MQRIESRMPVIDTEQMEMSSVRVDLAPASEITVEDASEIMNFMAIGYGERWQGEDNFRDNILANATQALRIYSNDELAASVLLDHDRISIIAVNPKMRGQGMGIKLFEEAAKARPNVWITVAADAHEMMATLTSEKLNFFLVEDKDAIEQLFRVTNQGRDKHEIAVETKEIPFLTERLKGKGIDHGKAFMVFTRAGGTHASAGKYYPQMIFQNRKS